MKYFDYAATTPPSEKALEAYVEVSREVYGNPGSDPRAREFETTTREMILEKLNLKDECDLIFTSGGTEANNLAIMGAVKNHHPKGSHFITTSFEHASVLEVFDRLDAGNFVTYLPIKKDGYVDLKAFRKSLRPETVLVSVMHVNNELGTIQPVKEMYEIVKDYNPAIEFMIDSVQGLGKCALLDFVPEYMTLSSHKIYGPKSVGCVIAKKGHKLNRLIFGGTKEGGNRAGTQSLPAQYGFANSIIDTIDNLDGIINQVRILREHLTSELEKIDDVYINAKSDTNVVSIFIDTDFKSSEIINRLMKKGFLISAKSADSDDRAKKSKSLKSIGLSDYRCDRTVRISLSHHKTINDINELVAALKEIVEIAPRSEFYEVDGNMFEDHLNLRKEVFCKEQGFSEEIEVDEYDDIENQLSHHYSLYKDGIVIGTGRIIYHENYIKFGRIAIKKEYRDQGYGIILVQKMMELFDSSVTNFYLEAQVGAVKFYNYLGFKEYGAPLFEEGVEHVKMTRKTNGYNQFKLI